MWFARVSFLYFGPARVGFTVAFRGTVTEKVFVFSRSSIDTVRDLKLAVQNTA
jgi:hypothetical protein